MGALRTSASIFLTKNCVICRMYRSKLVSESPDCQNYFKFHVIRELGQRNVAIQSRIVESKGH